MNYPDGCTQEMLDAAINDAEPEPDEDFEDWAERRQLEEEAAWHERMMLLAAKEEQWMF